MSYAVLPRRNLACPGPKQNRWYGDQRAWTAFNKTRDLEWAKIGPVPWVCFWFKYHIFLVSSFEKGKRLYPRVFTGSTEVTWSPELLFSVDCSTSFLRSVEHALSFLSTFLCSERILSFLRDLVQLSWDWHVSVIHRSWIHYTSKLIHHNLLCIHPTLILATVCFSAHRLINLFTIR